MARELLTLLHDLSNQVNLENNKVKWLHQDQSQFDGYCRRLLEKIMTVARQDLYVNRHGLNLCEAELLFVMGYPVYKYPIRRLVIACPKGLILVPSPSNDPLVPKLIPELNQIAVAENPRKQHEIQENNRSVRARGALGGSTPFDRD